MKIKTRFLNKIVIFVSLFIAVSIIANASAQAQAGQYHLCADSKSSKVEARKICKSKQIDLGIPVNTSTVKTIQGATGATGDKGDQGLNGTTGATGPKGDKGDQGSTGTTGATGSKGDKGDQGLTGTTGAKGDQGAAGQNGAFDPTQCAANTQIGDFAINATATANCAAGNFLLHYGYNFDSSIVVKQTTVSFGIEDGKYPTSVTVSTQSDQENTIAITSVCCPIPS